MANESDGTKKRPLSQHAVEAAEKAAGAVAGALVGLGIGGPSGALVGAVAGPTVTAVVRVVEEAVRKRFARSSEVFERAVELTGATPESLSALLSGDDDKLELTLQALTAAAQTTIQAKADAFAAAIAAAAKSSSKYEIDGISLIVKALAELDEMHLKVLKLVADASVGEASPEYIADHTGAEFAVLRPVVRLLELHGLIADLNRFDPANAAVIWEITDMGRLCLQLLGHAEGKKKGTK